MPPKPSKRRKLLAFELSREQGIAILASEKSKHVKNCPPDHRILTSDLAHEVYLRQLRRAKTLYHAWTNDPWEKLDVNVATYLNNVYPTQLSSLRRLRIAVNTVLSGIPSSVSVNDVSSADDARNDGEDTSDKDTASESEHTPSDDEVAASNDNGDIFGLPLNDDGNAANQSYSSVYTSDDEPFEEASVDVERMHRNGSFEDFLDDGTIRYLKGGNALEAPPLTFVDILRDFVTDAQIPAMKVTRLLCTLKLHRPVLVHEDLPFTGKTLMGGKIADRKGAKIFNIYEEKSDTSEDEDADVNNATGEDRRKAQKRKGRKRKRKHNPRQGDAIGKYVHFGLEAGIFGESISNYKEHIVVLHCTYICIGSLLSEYDVPVNYTNELFINNDTIVSTYY